MTLQEQALLRLFRQYDSKGRKDLLDRMREDTRTRLDPLPDESLYVGTLHTLMRSALDYLELGHELKALNAPLGRAFGFHDQTTDRGYLLTLVNFRECHVGELDWPALRKALRAPSFRDLLFSNLATFEGEFRRLNS